MVGYVAPTDLSDARERGTLKGKQPHFTVSKSSYSLRCALCFSQHAEDRFLRRKVHMVQYTALPMPSPKHRKDNTTVTQKHAMAPNMR
jgi:hypothetical protein